MSKRGFTLIELTIVLFLIGTMLFLAVPRIRDAVLTDDLTKTANLLNTMARQLRSDAVREQVDYVVCLDIDHNLFYTYSTDMTPEALQEAKKRFFKLPEKVKFADVYQFGEDKITTGEVRITFFRKGYTAPAVIHLSRGDDFMTLVVSPFLPDIKTYGKYLDFDYI